MLFVICAGGCKNFSNHSSLFPPLIVAPFQEVSRFPSCSTTASSMRRPKIIIVQWRMEFVYLRSQDSREECMQDGWTFLYVTGFKYFCPLPYSGWSAEEGLTANFRSSPHNCQASSFFLPEFLFPNLWNFFYKNWSRDKVVKIFLLFYVLIFLENNSSLI